LVAQDEFVIDQELALDGANRSTNPRISRRQEADERHQQQTGVEPLRTVDLHEAVELAIEAAQAHFGLDFISERPPALCFIV
jgi:hypothetical protein